MDLRNPVCRFLIDPRHRCANSFGEPLREGQVCHDEALASFFGFPVEQDR